MDLNVRIFLFIAITAAVGTGFAPPFLGTDSFGAFSSLHIFLFNLATGGTLLTIHLRGKKGLDAHAAIFFMVAMIFALAAAERVMIVCIVTALALGILVETLRWKLFSFFPVEFFRRGPVHAKFRHASILCLSMGLLICAATLTNDEYLHLIRLKKLGLHVFYLGFSFPLSLILFSEIFQAIETAPNPPRPLLTEVVFWSLNLGVIFFFLFILLEIYPLQMLMAICLFSATLLTVYMHFRVPLKDDPWKLLTSSLAFLVLGSITGMLYIVYLWKDLAYEPGSFLSLHSASTLFGWNLTWIFIASRRGQYPLKVPLWAIIAAHYATVLFMPIARQKALMAPPAMLAALLLLGMALFSLTGEKRAAD